MKQSQYLGARRCMKQNICNVYEHKVGGASTNCEACPRCGKHELEGATTLNNVHDVEKTNWKAQPHSIMSTMWKKRIISLRPRLF